MHCGQLPSQVMGILRVHDRREVGGVLICCKLLVSLTNYDAYLYRRSTVPTSSIATSISVFLTIIAIFCTGG